MQYWWVNQNRTAQAEWRGGYLWSPKRNADRRKNPFYEYMREVIPGDLILSFVKTRIPKIGVARSFAYSCPKPAEFGNAGPNWDRVGWRVDVHWIDLINKIRPADDLAVLLPHFPHKYAPLQNNGRGKQAIYLTCLPEALMIALATLIGHQAVTLMKMNQMVDGAQPDSIGTGQYEWEEHLRHQVEDAPELEQTVKEQLILSRRGQGLFKKNVGRIEHASAPMSLAAMMCRGKRCGCDCPMMASARYRCCATSSSTTTRRGSTARDARREKHHHAHARALHHLSG